MVDLPARHSSLTFLRLARAATGWGVRPAKYEAQVPPGFGRDRLVFGFDHGLAFIE